MLSLAFVEMHYDWNWPAAEREFRRAIELSSSCATAHHWFAYYLMLMGKRDESLAEIRRAQELDPLSLFIQRDVADMLYYARRYDEAIAQGRKTLERDPNFALANYSLFEIYAQKRCFPRWTKLFINCRNPRRPVSLCRAWRRETPLWAALRRRGESCWN